MTSNASLTCPECTSADMVPIVYGLPDDPLIEKAQRGEVILGGCTVLLGQSPDWSCNSCGHQFADEQIEDV